MKKRLVASLLALALGVTVLPMTVFAAGDITVNLGTEPYSLCSTLAYSNIDMNILRHCMEGLVVLNENDEAVPGVAKEVPTIENGGISEDGMTVTFNLREDAVWSNGEPVTAHDFVFAFNQLFNLQNASVYSGTWAAFIQGANEMLSATADGLETDAAKEAIANAGWKALDDYTFQVQLTGPYTFFVPLMAYQSFYPVNETAWNEFGGVASYGTEAEYFAFNGPYEITEWVHEDQVVLTKRADYWNSENVNLDSITMRMIIDGNAAFNEYLAGTMDMIGLSGDNAVLLESMGGTPLSYNSGTNFYTEYNTTKPGLNNAKVRRALTYAIDAQSFIEYIVKNESQVANAFTPDTILNGTFAEMTGDLMQREANGEIAGADEMPEVKALFEEGLAEEGIAPEDFKVTLLADEGDSVATMAAYIQEQYKKILGIDLAIEQVTFYTKMERQYAQDYDICFGGWAPDYNDPLAFLDTYATGNTNNHTGWLNEKYDECITTAKTELDEAVRLEALVEAEKILAEEMPVGYVYNLTRDYALSDRLTGVVRTGFQDMNFNYASIVE